MTKTIIYEKYGSTAIFTKKKKKNLIYITREFEMTHYYSVIISPLYCTFLLTMPNNKF